MLIFVPSTRKFHREEDFRKGFDCGPPMDERENEKEEGNDKDKETKKKKKSKKTKTTVKSAKEVLDSLDRICQVNEQLWYVRERILKNGESIDVEALAESTKKSLGEKGDEFNASSSSSSSTAALSSSKQKEEDSDDENKNGEDSDEDEDDEDDSNISTIT